MPKKDRLTLRGPLLALAMIAFGQHAAAAAKPLKGPWDDSRPASSHAASATPCTSAPTLPVDLQTADYYSDAAHSKIDPARKLAYDQATGPLHMAARSIDAMADRYQTSGDVSAAVCGASWLEAFSQAASSHRFHDEQSGNLRAGLDAWLVCDRLAQDKI